MALSAGTRLGPYEILAPLGAGGMGEVYRARDPRLDRQVAIKVLPEDVASDSERLRRFGKEARARPGTTSSCTTTHFTVYALDLEKCPVEGRFAGPDVLEAIEGHVLAQASIVATYAIYPNARVKG